MSIRKVFMTLNVRKAESQTTIEGLHVGDVGSTQLVISLTDGTRAIDLTKFGTVTAIIHGKKPDGYEIHNACTVEGGKIYYTLTAQDTAVSGTVYYQLDVQINGVERSFSPCFRTQVSERVYEPVFRLLDSEPEDWAQNYAKYYKKVDDVYVKNDDPAYAADTFYELVDPPVDSASEFQAFWSAFHKVDGLFNQRLIIDRTTTDIGYDPDNVHKVFINAAIQGNIKGVVFTMPSFKQFALCSDGFLRIRSYDGSNYSEWQVLHLKTEINASNKNKNNLVPSIKAVVDYIAAEISGKADSADVAASLAGKADVNHTHDMSAYITSTALQSALAGKADTDHTHSQYLTEHQDLSAYALIANVTAALALKADKDTAMKYKDITGSAIYQVNDDLISDKKTIYRVFDGLGWGLMFNLITNQQHTQIILREDGHLLYRQKTVNASWQGVSFTDIFSSYATTAAMTAGLAGKADISHTHDMSNYVQEAIVKKAIIANTEMLSPDITFEANNDDVNDYLTASAYVFAADNAYNSNDYQSTNVPADIGSSVNERPNHGTVTIPEGGAKITLIDTVAKIKWSESVSGGDYEVKNLIPNRLYTYTITNSSGAVIKTGSCKASGQVRIIDAGKAFTYPVSDPTTTSERPLFNIRDLGGWACDGGRLKYGLIYRGCRLNGSYKNNNSVRYGISITESQKAFFKNFLGIRDEIDLRQIKNDPDSGNTETAGDDAIYGTSDDITDTALGVGVDYAIYPIKPYYAGMLSGNAVQNSRYAAIINRIAYDIKNSKPCYVHCLEGADRTGMIAMLILGICGVSRSDIERDYELTSFSKDYIGNRNRRARNDSALSYRWMTLMQHLLGNTTGSTFRDKIIDYVIKIGVTVNEINTIRAGLIDGSPEKIKSPYADAAIQYNLTNIITDNPISSIALYQPFEVKLTALNMTDIQSVTVMMGGTDITSTAYNAERILIPKVTGDITITASATDVVIPDVSGKADKATTLAGYGITDAYTKAEVDGKVSSVYKYKGSVSTYQNLPSTDLTVGDVYNVESDGSNYAWTGSAWDKLGGNIDLSGSQIVSGVVNANGTIAFTDSDGNTFTTTGSSVIGPQGDDYVLTAQDKSDIADIVLSELPNADTMSF